jgi:transposase InsO family protein
MSWFEFIVKEANNYPISLLCEAVGVTTGAYYSILNKGFSKRVKEDEVYKSKILDIHQDSKYRYGHRPMYQHLQDEGIACGRDRTRRLMKELSIQPRTRRKFKPQATNSDHNYGYRPNLIKTIDKTNLEVDEIWVADTTYISIGCSWVYLAVIMDRSSRRIVGWSTSLKNDTDLVLKALKNAILTRGHIPLGTIHHSDRGSTYASHQYQSLLKSYGMKSSMSAKGNCYDNAAMESFFGRYKSANIGNFEFTNCAEVRSHVFDYIEVFYNRYRKHSSIGNISPAEFEEKNFPLRGRLVKDCLLNN